MEVTVTRLYGPGDAGAGVEAVAGEDGGGAGWWGGEAPQLQSFNDLRALGVQGGLLRRMKKARLNRPTPIQRCGWGWRVAACGATRGTAPQES
jgi:hypothetical protein